jgi:HK97 family phage major capsid protein
MPDNIRTIELGTQFRSVTILRDHVDEDARTVTLSFSSEFQVDRWFGGEVLDHSPGAVDLGRLNDAGPLLVDHDRGDHVGVIETASIGNDRRGHAVARFGRGARAEEIWRDVVDGIRSHVSVGYRIDEMKLEQSGDDGDVYRVTRWAPLEISVTAVAADPSVGLGRTEAPDLHTVSIIDERGTVMPDNTATTETAPITAPVTETRAAETAPAPVTVAPVPAGPTIADERARALEITETGARFNMAADAANAVRDGISVDAFNSLLLGRMAASPGAAPLVLAGGNAESPEIGLSPDEARSFSFVRAIQASLNGDWSQAGFEREVSDAAVGKLSQGQRGSFVVPYDVLIATRDLTVGTDASGGYLVGTDNLGGSFIELLRNRMMVQALGARVLDGLVGDVSIPSITAGAAGSWVAESGAPSETTQTTGQLALAPKTVTAYTDMSRKLIKQSSPAVEALVREDLASALALAIDSGAINGTGSSNQPTGILSTSGIGDVAGGTNGLAPTWAHIVELETDVATANADVGALSYLTSAKIRGKLKTIDKASGAAQFVWGDNAAAPGFGMVNGYRAGVSNQVPDTLTKGTSDVASAIIFGNWSDLIIAMWGALDVLVDPYTGSTTGVVRVTNHQDVDIGIRHAASFSAMQDALSA